MYLLWGWGLCRVVATLAPWIAASKSPNGFGKGFPETVLSECIQCIMGARWPETACA